MRIDVTIKDSGSKREWYKPELKVDNKPLKSGKPCKCICRECRKKRLNPK